ncbi:MAG: hypothetical protein IT480_18670 [Gammaproteobacteria bacterium]|nr:hypothetical protein [Gammaproteobacteria bacterium]
MTAATYYLSIPIYGKADAIIVSLTSETVADAREEAGDEGMVRFYEAGYEDDETVCATLYALGTNGGLAHSECFPISGPNAD